MSLFFRFSLSALFFTTFFSFGLSAKTLLLLATESDPDAFVQHVNVINGDYNEAATDLVIYGPDALINHRDHRKSNLQNVKCFNENALSQPCAFNCTN